jgi:hypothetical protein
MIGHITLPFNEFYRTLNVERRETMKLIIKKRSLIVDKASLSLFFLPLFHGKIKFFFFEKK